MASDNVVFGLIQETRKLTKEHPTELPFSLDIDDSNLSQEQRKLLHDMLHRHVGAFSRDDDDLGYIDNVNMRYDRPMEHPSGFLIDEYHPISNRKFDNIWRVG